jgi:radical SAM protein with 4Fe4S-binding SPASM domain
MADAGRIGNVALHLTDACQLRCRTCYFAPHLLNASLTPPGQSKKIGTAEAIAATTADASSGKTAEAGLLTEAEIAGFLAQVRPWCDERPSLTILGGEPLLVPDLTIRAARHAARLGFTAVVSTNGVAVTPAFARAAHEAGLQVQVSLDGATATVNDAIRGAGVFDRAIKGIETLVRAGVYVVISMVGLRDNSAELPALFRLAHSLGCREARCIPLKKMGAAGQNGLVGVSLQEIMRRTKELLLAEPELQRLAGRDALSIVANTVRYHSRRHSCGTGCQTLLLRPSGDIFPCISLTDPGFRLGNLREPDFQWDRFWNERQELRRIRESTRQTALIGSCQTCAVRPWCLGGCRGEAFARTKNLQAPAPNCADLRRSILEAFWILTDHPTLVPAHEQIC